MGAYSKQRIPEYVTTRNPPIELDIIADVDSIGGYEWDRLMVLRDPSDGRLYAVDGSGCSCNSLLQDVYSLNDLDGPFTVHEAAVRAQKWEQGDGETWRAEMRAGLGVRVVEALMSMERDS